MEEKSFYQKFISFLGQMDAHHLLNSLSEAKTGNHNFKEFITAEVGNNAEMALDTFLKALDNANTDDLLDKALQDKE
jgi:hypothetical protein